MENTKKKNKKYDNTQEDSELDNEQQEENVSENDGSDGSDTADNAENEQTEEKPFTPENVRPAVEQVLEESPDVLGIFTDVHANPIDRCKELFCGLIATKLNMMYNDYKNNPETRAHVDLSAYRARINAARRKGKTI